MQKGIIKPEAVFGNYLENLPYDEVTRLPEFLLRCVRKIETMMAVVGIYRVNGDAAAVQKLRYNNRWFLMLDFVVWGRGG